jgi:hypothetical protein
MSSNNDNTITARRIQLAKRWRVQRLIKLGEWVESRESIIRLASTSLFETFDKYMEDDDAFCSYTSDMMEAIDIMNDIQVELRQIHEGMPEHSKFQGEVVLTHRYACKDHKKEVFLEALPHEQQQDTPKEEKVKDEA